MSLISKPIEIFYSYAIEDERLRSRLEKHLSILKQQGFITTWHNRKVSAGKEWSTEINTHLDAAQIILLLISPDFLASDYCYSNDMMHAIERHNAKTARVIPIILRPVDWETAPFNKLAVLPQDGKPVTLWRNADVAFLEVARGIRFVIEEINTELVSSPLKEHQDSIQTLSIENASLQTGEEISLEPNHLKTIREMLDLLEELRQRLSTLKKLPSTVIDNDLYIRTDEAIRGPIFINAEKVINYMIVIEEIYEILKQLNYMDMDKDLYTNVQSEVLHAANELKENMNIRKTFGIVGASIGTALFPALGTMVGGVVGGLMGGTLAKGSDFKSVNRKEELIHLNNAKDHIAKALEYLQ